MIDFRYHIISIVAVFLALGVGIVVGTSGALDPFVSQQFTDQVSRLEREIADADEQLAELQQRADARDTLLDELTPWAVGGLLAGRRVVSVFDGGNERWPADAQESLVRAGASMAGRLTFTDRWRLDVEGAAEELQSVVQEVTPAFDPGDDPAVATIRHLGERFREPAGRALVAGLVEAGYLVLEGAGPGGWPPDDVSVVVFASAQPASSPRTRWLTALVSGLAEATPVLAVAGSPEDESALGAIRGNGEKPERLSTFDSGAADPTGIGTVLALEAAIEGRGGHFGSASGLRFLPDPPQPSPSPTGG